MSALCDLALAFGMTLAGNCQVATPSPDPLPPDDPSAWAVKVQPPPPPPAPTPAPVPNFPPVVIKQEVIREVPASVAAPVPQQPAPKVEAPKQPDPYELAARAAYASRSHGLPSWQSVAIPASLPRTSAAGSLGTKGSIPKLAAGPLDLAAVVKSRDEAEYEERAIVSTLPVDNSRKVTTDRYISAIVETGINTQLDGSTGGPVVLQVSRDVFGYHSRNILIPKGSRMVCGFKPLDKVGSSRAPLRCSRILLGGNRAEIFGMKANATDMQGGFGVSGEVDNRFWERYGTAFILTGISAAVRAASTSTTTSESLANRSPALQTGGEELSERLGDVTATTLEKMISLNPILKIAQGTRIQIRPDTDWYIRKIGSEED